MVPAAFCVELKSRFPTTLSDGSWGFAYYNSSIIQSNVPEHQINYQMYQSIWAGLVEVRIRLYDQNNTVIFCTHEEYDYEYPFEPIPQGYRWDSTYDGYYFLVDPEIESVSGTVTPTFQWSNVEDEDPGQTISYQLQWSLTPLFLEGIYGQLGTSNTRTVDCPGFQGVFSSISTLVDVKAPVFYRVRAFDGLDYGEWSKVNGYFNTPSSAPYCIFNWVIPNCTSSDPNVLIRPDGEVEISFRVVDLDSPIVSAYLTYRLSTEDALVRKPCSLDSSTAAIPSNEDIVVSWHSARQLPNQSVIVYLYLYAFDGFSQSYEVTWSSSVVINNIGIGFGYSDSTDDVMSYRFSGITRNYERWIMIPEEKAESSIQDGQVIYKPISIPEGSGWESYRFDWATYWSDFLREELSKYLYSIADQIAYRYYGKIKRPYFNLYDGYDNGGRIEYDKLYLEYRDEFEAREKDESERFQQYFEIESGISIGRGINNITYFLKAPEFGAFRIRRPTIVKAGNSGLYLDGASINNSVSDIFGDVERDQGIQELLKKEIWKNFYQIDPMYYPGVDFGFSFMGPINYNRYDESNQWYWTLFEYTVDITFPFGITRGVNDQFSYRLNGMVYNGSLLEDEMNSEYVSFSGSLSSQLRRILNTLFPLSIFQDIENNDITISGNKYQIRIYSQKIDSNRTFQFVDAENNCYKVFGIDTNLRFSKRFKSNWTSGNYVISKPYEKGETSKAVFEVPCDTGNCIGNDGEINTSEPLFTCDPVHLNQYGCHYKYTPARYLASRKVYIRKYFVRPVYMEESNEPLRDKLEGENAAPKMGYRNYKLKYVGKNSLGELLFSKVELPGRIGGRPAKCKKIPVIFETRETEDNGWWLPDGDIDSPKDCISHEYDESKKIYYRKSPVEYVKQIGFQDCFCTEYVELNEGWEKPFYNDSQNISRIDKRQPIAHVSEIPQGYIQYVMGAYKPPKNQQDIISAYDNNFTSVVESESGYNLQRYLDNWDESNYERLSEKLGIVVDPIFIEPGGVERYIEKWGYVPDHTLETYFKEDTEGIWKDRIIPKNNSYVHGILRDNDISFPYVSRIHLFRRIISDVNKIELPEEEGVKAPYLDYRFLGGNPLEERYYYSALPQDESPAYSGRPPEIYGEDRPLRISGFIDSMSTLIPWKFLYLQTEWNSYNLIHWEGAQDESVYAKLEVALVNDSGTTGTFMTLRTKDAEWFPKYSCWLIPFEKLKQSDYIDTLNGTFTAFNGGVRTDYNFVENQQYRFRVSGVNINSGAANTPVLSNIFTYSRDAYSPPIITSVEYDKWNHEFCLEFRFDDIRGRKYDIINFYYATYDPNEQSPPDSEFIELGTDYLSGNLIDLDSNTTGDDVISESYLIKHKVYFSSDVLQDITGKNIRFRLECIASEDREGMTSPVFHFLMWGNEFLKKADNQINSIVGTKNRWVYDTYINDDGETVEQWVYLPEDEAVIVPGILAEQTAIIEEINQKFEDWYITVAKFEFPGFDAQYHYLQIQENEDELYSSVFDAFVVQYDLQSEWDAYKAAHNNKTASYLEPLFIAEKYSEDFSFFWDNRASFLIGELEGFSEWFEENRILTREESKSIFINQTGQSENYQNYLTENSLTDNDDSRTEFIVENSLQSVFEEYYESLNNYPDNRYDDRKAFVEAHYSAEYTDWQQSPVDAYGNVVTFSNEDESLRLFIAHDRAIWNSMIYTNSGKSRAKNYYLTVMENGITYGQQLQTANSQIVAAQKTLNEAYATRNHYETIHRRKLISRGYFSNGWKNNQVYVGEELNEPFRFRVENQPITGKRYNTDTELEYDGTLPDKVEPLPGYDTRWDIYFHFQLDFYDSFDSQNGKPLRDYLWQRLDCSGYAGSDVDSIDVDGVPYIRIMGGIEAETGGMHVLPDNVYTPNSGEYGKTPTTDDPYSFQFAGRFSILKSELPGELETDQLPEHWNTGENSTTDDFNQVYFWRVCPYNLVKRPVFEREITSVNSIEYFGESTYYRNKYWKATVLNSFWGNHKYSNLQSENIYYGYCGYYVWVATKTITPVWQRDFLSTCWNSKEAFYENFFPGTDSYKSDIDDYTQNPSRSSYRSRIERGEIVFLTDRPRELLTDGTLQYIEEPNDHFRALWIQFNVKRSNPWMMFDNDEKCWFLISQKHSKNRSDYTEYVFTLSRGLSPQTFGEECQLFPTSTLDSVNTIIEGAQSFEAPCLLKVEGRYRLYFETRKEGGVYESWTAESSNLYDWENFTQLTFQYSGENYGQICRSMSVYYREGVYSMYCLQGTVIRHFTSTDGINFQFVSTIHSDMYKLTRPTLVKDRVYFGIEFGEKGKILSIDQSGDYSTLRVEKGSQSNFEEAITFNAEDCYFNPMLLEDIDKGTPITRMIYEQAASVYAYNGTSIAEIPSIQERAFFTEYREEYSWDKVYLNSNDETNYSSSTIYINENNYPIIKNSEGNNVSLSGEGKLIPTGKLEILFNSQEEPLALKVPFYLEPEFEDTESEGEWLDFYNVDQTEAQLSPEEKPEDYVPSEYTTERYILENDLLSEYSEWLSENYPAPESGKEENYRVEFLLSCKQYSLYLKWSKKGPGIYRHLNAVKRTSYVGDGD